MTWQDQGLYFSLILNGIALAVLIPLAFILHTNGKLYLARVFRPNHTIEPKSLNPVENAKLMAEEEEARRQGGFVTVNSHNQALDGDDGAASKKKRKNPHEELSAFNKGGKKSSSSPRDNNDNENDDPLDPDHNSSNTAADGGAFTDAVDVPPMANGNRNDTNAVDLADNDDDTNSRSNGGGSNAEEEAETMKDLGDAVAALDEAANESIAGVMGRLDTTLRTNLFRLPNFRRILKVGEEAWEEDGDDVPLRKDPNVDLFLLFIKVCMIAFLVCTSLSTTWLTAVSSQDSYIHDLEMTTDSIKCREKEDEGACNDHKPVCTWYYDVFRPNGGYCEPDPQAGLDDLSIQNISMHSHLFYAVGILALLFGLLLFFVVFKSIRSVTRYHTRVLKRQLRHAIGFRTVVVKGLKCPDSKLMKSITTKEEITIPIRHPDSNPADADSCISDTLTKTIKVVPNYVEGFPASDPETFKRMYLSSRAYFGPTAEEKALMDAEEQRLAAEQQELEAAEEAAAAAEGRVAAHKTPEAIKQREKDAKAKQKKEKAQRKNDAQNVGGLMGISIVGGKARTADDFALFRDRDLLTGISSKIEDLVIERSANSKFYPLYEEYENARLAYQDAVADERQYHEFVVKQRELAYRHLDEVNAKQASIDNAATAAAKKDDEDANTNGLASSVTVAGGSNTDAAAGGEGQQEEEDTRLIKYEKESLLPPLMGRVLPNIFCPVPIVAHRKNDLLKKGEALNKCILKNKSTPFCGTVFIVFKDAVSAFEFVEIFENNYGGIFSPAMAKIAGPYNKLELVNLSISKHISWFIGIIMACIFAALVLFWSIPVAFFGSIESLATIPGIGPPFQKIIDALPVVIVGILTAYLPVIVLAIFNIFLPILIRFFVRSSGSLTSLETDHGVLIEMYLFIVLTGVVFQAALQGGVAQLGAIITDPTKDTIFAFITSIISPKGGYWFANVISAGCLAMWLNALFLGPFIMMMLLSKRASNQRTYNGFFAHQIPDWPLRYAFTMLPMTIGFFFHVTVPLIGIFVGIFFLNMYFVYRGILIDNHAPEVHPDQLVSNFSFTAVFYRALSATYMIAAIGACIVVGLREHVGGLVFCVLAAAVSAAILLMVIWESRQWTPNLDNVTAALTSVGSEKEQQQNKRSDGGSDASSTSTPTLKDIEMMDKEKEVSRRNTTESIGSHHDEGGEDNSPDADSSPRSGGGAGGGDPFADDGNSNGQSGNKKRHQKEFRPTAAVDIEAASPILANSRRGRNNGARPKDNVASPKGVSFGVPIGDDDGDENKKKKAARNTANDSATTTVYDADGKYVPPPSCPASPYASPTNPKLDGTEGEEDTMGDIGAQIKRRKPYHNVHTILTQPVVMDEAIRVAEEKAYSVVMMWHGESTRIKNEISRQEEVEDAAKDLQKAIIKGKHKVYVPAEKKEKKKTEKEKEEGDDGKEKAEGGCCA